MRSVTVLRLSTLVLSLAVAAPALGRKPPAAAAPSKAATASPGAEAKPAEPARPPAGAAPVRAWTIEGMSGPMGDSKGLQATMVALTRWGSETARIVTRATCNPRDAYPRPYSGRESVDFYFRVISDLMPNRGFARTMPEWTWHTSCDSFDCDQTKVYKDGRDRPWTRLWVRVGEGPTHSYESWNDYGSEVHLAQSANDLEYWPSPGIFKPRVLRVQLPIDNGINQVIEISLRDPSFIEFVDRCWHTKEERAALGGSAEERAHVEAPPPRLRPYPLNLWPADPVKYDAERKSRPAARASDAYVFGTASDGQDIHVEGTVGDFVEALPGLIRRHGFDPANYSKEIAYVAAALRTCMRVTPEMGAQVPRQMDGDWPYWDLTRFGAQYRVCSHGPKGEDVSKNVDATGRRHLWFQISPGKRGWNRTPNTLFVVAQFSPQPDDQDVGDSDDDYFVAYLIGDAMIMWP